MKHFFAFCRRNRLFAALLAAELAVVCALAAGLFGAPYKLALTPGDFTNTLPDIAAADDDGLKIWNQIGYHSDDPMTFSADNIALPSGAYEVTVRYFSCQTPDAPTFNMLNAAGSLTFASERSPAAVTFDALRLDDCHRSLTTRLWVGFGARMQDLPATVCGRRTAAPVCPCGGAGHCPPPCAASAAGAGGHHAAGLSAAVQQLSVLRP